MALYSPWKTRLQSKKGRGLAAIVAAGALVAGTATAQAVSGSEQVVLLVSATPPTATPGPDCKTSPDAENCETRLSHATLEGPIFIFIRSGSGRVTKVNFYLNDGIATTQAYTATSNPYVLNKKTSASTTSPATSTRTARPTAGVGTTAGTSATDDGQVALFDRSANAVPSTAPKTKTAGTVEDSGAAGTVEDSGTGTAGTAGTAGTVEEEGTPTTGAGAGTTGTEAEGTPSTSANVGLDTTTALEDGTNTVLAEVFANGKSVDLFARFTIKNNKTTTQPAAAVPSGVTKQPSITAGTGSGTSEGTGKIPKPTFSAFTRAASLSASEEMDNLDNFYKYEKEGDFGNKSPSNIFVASGIMTISGKSDGTTGGVAHRHGQKYGRWEARVKIEGEEGCWRPNILLWPDAENYPIGGEIDYAESGGNFDAIDMFLHYGADNRQVTGHAKVDARQWNTYAVEWTPEYIAAYVNGKKFFEETDTTKFPPGPMHQAFQLDAQHSDTTCHTNTQMLVDSLKVSTI